MNKRLLLSVVGALFLVAASAPAFAGSCPMLMKDIDAAMASSKLSKKELAKVQGLRSKGEAMHKTGKHAESVKALNEAKEILGIK